MKKFKKITIYHIEHVTLSLSKCEMYDLRFAIYCSKFNFFRFSLFIILFLFPLFSFSQDTVKVKNWKLKGYVSAMPSFSTKGNTNSTMEGLVHNRLNFSWNLTQSISTEINLRNRLMFNNQFPTNKVERNKYSIDKGAVDLTKNIFIDNAVILNASFDRALLKYSKGKFDVTAGRQRVNWGQTFVWNPNDIFNAYSFFDFDYAEKQGSDACRVQFYPSAVSVIEAAVKVDNQGKITGGVLWKFNKWNYDFQIVGGMINEQDYMTGLGWSGNIKNIGIRGEASYFHQKNNFEDTSGIVTACIAADYTFSNQAFLQFEFLYNMLPEKNKNLNMLQFSGLILSAKKLSFTEYNLFAQFSYPVTSLLKASFATIYYPAINWFYAGPSVEYSIRENLDASIIVQGINGELRMPPEFKKQRMTSVMAFLRVKWSF